MQGATRATDVNDGFGKPVEDLADGQGFTDDGEGVQVSLIRSEGDLGAPSDINKALTHREPTEAGFTVAGHAPPDLPAARVIDGGLDSQYAALLVVHFDRVFLDPVLDSGSFYPKFETALDLGIGT